MQNSLITLILKFKNLFIGLFLLSLCVSLLEFIGLALIIPVFSLILESGSELEFSFFGYQYYLEKKVLIVGLPIVYFLRNVIIIILKHAINGVVFMLKSRIEISLLRHYLFEDAKVHATLTSSNISNLILTEVSIFTFNFMHSLVIIFIELVFVILGMSFLIYYDLKTFLMLIVPSVFVLVFPIFVMTRKQKKLGESNKLLTSFLYKEVTTLIKAFKEIKIYGLERFILNSFAKNSQSISRNYQLSHTYANIGLPLIETIIVMILFTFIYINLYVSVTPTKELITVLSVFGLVLLRILPSCSRLITGVNQVNFGYRSLNEIATKLKTNETARGSALNATKLKLAVSNLSYAFDNKFVFKDLNFSLQTGEMIGITGKSGSGKSTLMNIISGLYSDYEGRLEVLADGLEVNLNQINIAYVPQDPYILEGSLAENIAIGINRNEIDYKYVDYLIDELDLRSLVEDNANETVLKADIENISGGQRARIGLARALYRRSDLLIIDEITSSLDTQTAEIVMAFIAKCNFDRAIVMITHRSDDLVYFEKHIDMHSHAC